MISDIIILAGGLGTRLRSVVSHLPKPMAPVKGRPFMSHVLDRLDTQQLNKFIFSIGYLGQAVKNEYGNVYKGRPVIYSEEKEPLGTGGAIKLALQQAETDQVIILNGDTFFEFDLHEFHSFHKSNQSDLSVGLKQLAKPDRYGTVELEGTRIIASREKRQGLETGLINGGVYCINRDRQAGFPQQDKFSFETEVLERMVEDWKVCGFVSDGTFLDIGIPEDYERASDLF